MVTVLEDASTVATDVAMGKMHTAAARKAVETVAMEAAMAALCAGHGLAGGGGHGGRQGRRA
jgi:hypothetical protein